MIEKPSASATEPGLTSTVSARRTRWRRIRWTVRITVVALLIGYPLIVGLDGLFYYPDRRTYWSPTDFGLKAEDVYFRSDDGLSLHGWWLPATGKARGVVVHFHGNAANITNHIALAAWLPHHGFHTLMFDYRGYGQSEGRVTREGTIKDGHAAVTLAAERARKLGLPLFAYGQSLGGAVAVVVTADRPEVAAIVSESSFGSYQGIAARHSSGMFFSEWIGGAVARASISAGHDPVDVVAKISPRPILVIGAEHDTICFPELARQLYDAAREPKEWWLVPDAGHLAILDGHEYELIERITNFLDRAGK